jgi:hypothetical protein
MKKKYEKPEINQVKLSPEETTLTACKTGPGALGAGSKDCDHNGCKASIYGS